MPADEESALDALNNLNKAMQDGLTTLRAMQILQTHSLQILRQDVHAIARALNLKMEDGRSFSDSFKDRLKKTLETRLEEIAKTEPGTAAALQKALKHQQVLSPATGSEAPIQ